MRVGVIGAGFAGLAAAIAFRGGGHDVTVFERTAGPSTTGGAIVLARNALACLEILGVRHRVDASPWSQLPATVRRPDGRVLVRSTISGLTGGGQVATVPRRDVIGWLAAQLPSTCLRYSTPARELGVDGTVVAGGDREGFDLVVAADGVHSVARSRLWTSASRPRSTGIAGWAWIVDQPLSDGFGTIWGARADFGILPLVDGRTYVYGGAPRGTELGQFRHWAAPLPGLIDAMRPDHTATPEIFEARPPRNICRGKVVLIGDAAHAMRPSFGQGAALAMEDAITLARGGVSGLTRRRSRVLAMYYASKAGSRFATPGSATLEAIRNWSLHITPDALFGAMAGSASRWNPPVESAEPLG
ncbi:FAD-dependent monooxygenase [Mycolicibacterium sp. S2-37]|uniref:FAD-dependent oxidoreductase n=1 Tax=Mycolicibacterium sp. S2-37 TaxID=2810297 RepID=UPI001A9409B0|nr:NAD(P)/FAD-dependent oxidoreductase [Mycolicibacterium sp. S2-37]MBO0676039.1 FAD-dependent monooxygenase [Mycolicibacterium sp. S2-37]